LERIKYPGYPGWMVVSDDRVADEPVAEAMYSFVDAYDRAYEAAASAQDLSVAQVCVLVRLREPRAMGSLAMELQCDASNITQIVNRLESRGLVAREADPTDRRARLLRLTRDGRRAVRSFERAFAFSRDAIVRLSPEEGRVLIHLLGKALGKQA